MISLRSLLRCSLGSAAVEMALVTPLLLTIGFGSAELGNYFYNEHVLSKAVRDGARYAARQGFSYYDCTGSPGGTIVDDTRRLVMTSLLSGGSNQLPYWNATTISVTERCAATATDDSNVVSNMGGIYNGRASGAPIVMVSATVPYTPIIGTAFGFSGRGLDLYASQEAAVAGI